MSAKRFGELVRLRREELGMNQSQLAKRAKVPKTTISDIEATARKEVYASTLFKIAKALQWDAQQVYNAYHDKNPASPTNEMKNHLICQTAIEFSEKIMMLNA